MKTALMLTVAALLALSAPAPVHAADQIDLSTIKCKDFLNSPKESIALILMWLEGYYADDDADPIVDFDDMKENGGKLGEYCAKNPEHSLITGAEEIYGK